MNRPQGQRGEGRASFFITLAVFAAGVFLAVKIVPVRVDAYQFRDTLREEARFASVHRDDKEVYERILSKADALEIPLDPDDLKIERTRTQVKIAARYEQSVDLLVTTYTFRFDAEEKAPVF